MMGVADTAVIPFKRVLKKYPTFLINDFSVPVSQKITNIPPVRSKSRKEEDFPIDQWTMPPQPQRFIKCADHDFF